MADLSTLVTDIYNLVDQGHVTKGSGSELGQTISTRLEEHQTPRKGGTLRMSNIGYPSRKLWFEVNRPELAERLSPETKLKFMIGDLTEAWVLWLAEESGHTVTDRQAEVVIDDIKGHIDAVIDGVVVDVKSASSASFKRFYKDSMTSDPFLSNYLYQLAGYAEFFNRDGALLVADKQMGKLKLICWSLEELKQFKIKETIKQKKEAVTQVEMPPRCYETIKEDNLNEKLPVGCSYCSYKFECYKDANDGQGLRIFKYSNNWAYLSHVEKLPRVEEVLNKDTI